VDTGGSYDPGCPQSLVHWTNNHHLSTWSDLGFHPLSGDLSTCPLDVHTDPLSTRLVHKLSTRSHRVRKGALGNVGELHPSVPHLVETAIPREPLQRLVDAVDRAPEEVGHLGGGQPRRGMFL
jgi:hypothetical protein